jgi:hypothetical protein
MESKENSSSVSIDMTSDILTTSVVRKTCLIYPDILERWEPVAFTTEASCFCVIARRRNELYNLQGQILTIGWIWPLGVLALANLFQCVIFIFLAINIK